MTRYCIECVCFPKLKQVKMLYWSPNRVILLLVQCAYWSVHWEALQVRCTFFLFTVVAISDTELCLPANSCQNHGIAHLAIKLALAEIAISLQVFFTGKETMESLLMQTAACLSFISVV